MSLRKITGAVFWMAVATAVSRLFGLFREIVSARVFGTTFIYDAFLVAFMIPNFFRGLLAEGALSTAFIPVFTEYLSDEEKKGEVRKIANICFTLSLVATCALFLVALAFSFLVPLFVPPTAKAYWVFSLLKYTFPYLVFISLAALNMGILNSYKHFAAPGYAPVILDAAWIAALLFLCPRLGPSLDRQILGLCAGIAVGGAGQFFFQVPPLTNRNISYRLDFDFRHPAVIKMGRLLTPVLIGVAVGPINLMVDYSLANLLPPGCVSALWYATRVFQLPLGIFAVSLATVILPWFSEHVARRDYDALKRDLYSSFNLLFLLIIPSTIGLMLLGTETVSVLFRHGQFDLRSVHLTANALLYFNIGLIGYGGASVITRAFYGFHDTRTPVLVGVASIAVNALLDLVLMRFLQEGGIALSTSFVGICNFLLLLYFFNRKHLRLDFQPILAGLARIAPPAAVMTIVLLAVKGALAPRVSTVGVLAGSIVASAAAFLLAAHVTKPLGKRWI